MSNLKRLLDGRRELDPRMEFDIALMESGVDAGRRAEIMKSFVNACAVAEATMGERSGKPYAPLLGDSSRLARQLSEAMLGPESIFNYPEEFMKIHEYLASGGNVIITPNHESGVDNMALFALFNRINPDLNEKSVSIADSVPMDAEEAAFYNGFNRIQVYSQQSISESPEDADDMKSRNRSALRELMRRVKQGGNLIILYPEGELDGGKLRHPSEGSSEILEVVGRMSPKGSVIYPVHLTGTREIMPEDTGFDNMRKKLRSGKVTVNVGEPIDLGEFTSGVTGDTRPEFKRLAEDVMHMIAGLAEDPRKRGRYGR
ncbi:MAG: 1-acyl-sn-glycerol-3-phosphate acyltransferase [Candidatus Altiarchaeota archaeon]